MAATLRYGAKNWSNPWCLSNQVLQQLVLLNQVSRWMDLEMPLLSEVSFASSMEYLLRHFRFPSQTCLHPQFFPIRQVKLLIPSPQSLQNIMVKLLPFGKPSFLICCCSGLPRPLYDSVPTVSVIETISMTTELPRLVIHDEINALIRSDGCQWIISSC